MVMNTRAKASGFDEKATSNKNGGNNNNVFGALNYGTRNRTESESSNTSVSSVTSVSSIDSLRGGRQMVNQKDKDSYFWVM